MVIVGGGFAGLSAAYTLMKRGITALVRKPGAFARYRFTPMGSRPDRVTCRSPRGR